MVSFWLFVAFSDYFLLLVMVFFVRGFRSGGGVFLHVHVLGCLFLPVRADADTTFYSPIGVDVFVFYYHHCLQLLLLSLDY